MAKQYVVLDNLHHNGVSYEADDEIELDPKIGKPLVEAGILREKVAPKVSKSQTEALKQEEK